MPVPVTEVLSILQRLAPLDLAEPWDNVGLLLEPAPAPLTPPLSDVLLTIDLSDQVVSEAEALGAKLIVAYHPPILEGLKRLRSTAPAERSILRCVAAGIALYSPHTALDAAAGGVNDWLLDAFGQPESERAPCFPHPSDRRLGGGRFVHLAKPIELAEAVERLKRHLGLTQLRLAAAEQHASGAQLVRRIAVCAGAGGSVFDKLSGFDLFVTGEMRHHDVLAKVRAGSSVLLSEHTHTERGYLRLLAERLRAETHGGANFHVSRCDRDPLCLV